MKRSHRKILIYILSIILLIGSCTIWRYKKSLDEEARKWYEKEYVGKQFFGRIRSINEYENNPYKVVISIDDTTAFHISYGVTCVDQMFVDFVAEGDSVFKTEGSKYIKFCKSDKRCREIELNFCGKFK